MEKDQEIRILAAKIAEKYAKDFNSWTRYTNSINEFLLKGTDPIVKTEYAKKYSYSSSSDNLCSLHGGS